MLSAVIKENVEKVMKVMRNKWFINKNVHGNIIKLIKN
jgi:hypothetical protein